MIKLTVALLWAIGFAVLMWSCATPGPVTTACQQAACASSQICALGGPTVVFTLPETGLAGAITADPALKAPINSAYTTLLKQFSAPNLTWGNVADDFATQAAQDVSAKWSPLVQDLINQLSGFVPGGAVSACDQDFLIQHCRNVLSFTGTAYKFKSWKIGGNYTAPSGSFSFGAGSLGIKVGAPSQ